MKDWNDFLPDDENEENDDVFGTNNPYIERQREVEKALLLTDIQRGNPIPLTPSDWEELFKLEEDDLSALTQIWIRHYHRIGDSNKGKWNLLDLFGREWTSLLLVHNEEVEEYELCAIIHEYLTWIDKQKKVARKQGINIK